MNHLPAIICAYLDGEPGSAEVLNDLLEESSRARAARDGSPEERLAIVVDEILPARDAALLACDFAEHVLPVVETSEVDQKFAVEAIAARRKHIDGQLSDSDLHQTVRPVFHHAWNIGDSRVLRAAWSAWAAAMGKPSNSATAAQAARDGELNWQLQRTKEVLLQLADFDIATDES